MMAGLLCLLFATFLFFENEQFINVEIEEDVIVSRMYQSAPSVWLLRVLMIIVSGILDFLVIIHYRLKLEEYKEKGLIRRGSTLVQVFKYQLLVELLICSLFVPPGLESKIGGRMLDGEWEYSWATIISLFSTLKFYLLVRTYDHLSLFMQQNFEALVRKHQFKLTPVFKQKMELKYRPYAYIGWLALSIILYFGYLIRTVEITFQSGDGSSFHFTYILDSFWMTMATMTTVGYGDFYPRTHVG